MRCIQCWLGKPLHPHGGGGEKPGCLAISLHDETGCNTHGALLSLTHQPQVPQKSTTTMLISETLLAAIPSWCTLVILVVCKNRRCLREMPHTGTSSFLMAWRAVALWTTLEPNHHLCDEKQVDKMYALKTSRKKHFTKCFEQYSLLWGAQAVLFFFVSFYSLQAYSHICLPAIRI